MDGIGYEVYRLAPRADIEHLRFRPYHYLQTNGIRATVDNYILICRNDTEKVLSAKEIRSQLEAEPPPPLATQPLGLSDVIALTKAGITSAFYVDPTKLIPLPDFFHQPGSGAMITMDTENWPIDGRKGNWMTIDTLRVDGRDLYLMQSQDYGREAPYVIVDEQGKELAADLFFASNNSKKLHPKMEKVASPFWRKLQAARQGCQSAAQTALQTYH